MKIRDKTTTNKWNMREVINHLTYTHLLNTIKSNPNTNFWKTLQEESSWHDRFLQPVFLKHFKQNSSRYLSVKQKYKIAYINKKHVYQERKETTHREIDKNVITTSSNLYITKSWSVAFNFATLTLSHVNSHVIINSFPIFYTIF